MESYCGIWATFNLLSSLLRNDNALERISTPVFFFFFNDHVLLKLGITVTFDTSDSLAIATSWTRVMKVGDCFCLLFFSSMPVMQVLRSPREILTEAPVSAGGVVSLELQ